MSEELALDHVVVGVPDLDEAAAVLLVRHGLIALPGGEHPRWGTRNRIVPLGPCYLEIVAVADDAVAAQNPFGSWVAAMARGEASWGWAVRTSDITATAQRLGIDVVPGERVRADGVRLSWRLAGVPASTQDRLRPFFIQWDAGTPMPGEATVPHPAGAVTLVSAIATGEGLGDWLAAPVPLVALEPGAGGVERVVLSGEAGEIVLTAPLDAGSDAS